METKEPNYTETKAKSPGIPGNFPIGENKEGEYKGEMENMVKPSTLNQRCCSKSNEQKYEILNYYSHKLILHYTKKLTHIPSIFTWAEILYPFEWFTEKLSLEMHQDINFHTACIEIAKLCGIPFKEHKK